MQYDVSLNQWLLVRVGVTLTHHVEPVICLLDPFFERAGFRAWVTSALRDPTVQLRLIQRKAREYGIDKDYPEIRTCGLDDQTRFGSEIVAAWAPAWSRLLTFGYMVNPPREHKALFDYRHPRKGQVLRGVVIPPSPHFAGTAFDISGGEDGPRGDESEAAVIREAMASGAVPGIKGFLVEEENNAVHVDCHKVEERIDRNDTPLTVG